MNVHNHMLCFILSVDDDLVNEGASWIFRLREARLRIGGVGTTTDGNIRSRETEKLNWWVE
jgi:hypothetical protein